MSRTGAPHAGAVPSLPPTPDRRRVYVLPTRHGLLFLLVLAAALVGAINYQNNLAFLLTFLLAALGMVSLVHGYRNLLGVTLRQIDAMPVFAGRAARFRIGLGSGARDRMAVQLSLDGAAAAFQDLAAGREETVDIALPTSRRGLLQTGRLVVSSTYPMGLFRVWAVLASGATCLVYPRPVASGLPLAPDDAPTGRARGDGPGIEDFQGLTPYQAGDPLQHLHWKGFARGQGLYTKRYSEPRGSGRLLDWFAVPEPDPERRIGILCHAVLESERHKRAYGLRLPQRMIRPAVGSGHRHRCLEALARMPAADEARS